MMTIQTKKTRSPRRNLIEESMRDENQIDKYVDIKSTDIENRLFTFLVAVQHWVAMNVLQIYALTEKLCGPRIAIFIFRFGIFALFVWMLNLVTQTLFEFSLSAITQEVASFVNVSEIMGEVIDHMIRQLIPLLIGLGLWLIADKFVVITGRRALEEVKREIEKLNREREKARAEKS